MDTFTEGTETGTPPRPLMGVWHIACSCHHSGVKTPGEA